MSVASTSAGRPAALAFIFVTIVLDMLAIGMIVPVLPLLITEMMDGDMAQAAEFLGLLSTMWAVTQFLSMPLLGALSDRFGRRPIVLLSNFGLAASWAFQAWAPTLGWLFVGRLISGATAASVSTAYAYVADVTPPERRSGAFGMLGVAFGLGFVVGPAIGGVLGWVDPRLPFWVAAALGFANGLYGLFILPESLPPERRAAFAWRRANPVGALLLLRSHAGLLGLAAVYFLNQLTHVVFPSVWVLYVAYRYDWDVLMAGANLAFVGLFSAAVQGGLVGRLVKRFGERRVVLGGFMIGIVAFTIAAVADTPLIFWFAVPVLTLWGVSGPALQGLMTHRVSPSEQGRLQGANGALQGIGQIIGPSLFTVVFAASIRPGGWDMPGAAMMIAALLVAAALAFAWRYARPAQTGAAG